MSKAKNNNGRRKPTKDRVTAALNQAARDAVKAHRKAGLPLVTWKDGQTALVPAEEVETSRPRRKAHRTGKRLRG